MSSSQSSPVTWQLADELAERNSALSFTWYDDLDADRIRIFRRTSLYNGLSVSSHCPGIRSPREVPMRLLIAEDDEKLSAALARGLRGEGYAVDVAGTGEEALL